MNPLGHITSLKLKIGIVIVAAIVVALSVFTIGLALDVKQKIALLVAIVIALLTVKLLARGMTAPLREMAVAAQAMARGEHGQRVSAGGKDEVAQLAVAFNEMSAELEQTDRLRRDLVANVAHELRTPLTALQATLENMVDGVQPPDRDSLDRMHGQVERLGRMVEQLLDLSRLEAGELPVRPARFGVGELLETTCDEAAAAAPDGVRFSAVAEPHDLTLVADPERIHQVLANLIANAARVSPAGGEVHVRASRAGDAVQLSVEDEGPGIPAEERERVFERFHSVDRSRTGGGAGLGLAICRWIVEMHGGTIRAEGREPHGCRMVVELENGVPA